MSDSGLVRFAAFVEENMLAWPIRDRIKLRRIMRAVTARNAAFYLTVAFLIDLPDFLDHVVVQDGNLMMRASALESMRDWAAVQGLTSTPWGPKDGPDGLAEAA